MTIISSDIDVNAASGALSGGHIETILAGKRILQQGGNALDAAIACLLASFVVEPCMSSPGGGFFATIIDRKKNIQVLDAFCQTPTHHRIKSDSLDFFPIEIDFGSTKEEFHVGHGSVAVPGAIAGVFALHKAGARLPLEQLAEYAIHIAHQGVPVDPFQAYDFQLLDPILKISKEASSFYIEEKLIQENQLLSLPRLGDFLHKLVRNNADWFYTGEPAQIIEEMMKGKGYLNSENLASFKVEVRDPIHFKKLGWDIFTNPQPSAGGAILKEALLNMPETLNPSLTDIAAALREAYKRRPNLKNKKVDGEGPLKKGGTTHFNVIDKWGNAVALSSSNGEGSGCWLPGAGLQLNNMLGEAALFPEGFHRWKQNVRVASLMSPTIAQKGNSILAIGTGGAGRIPGAIAQVLNRITKKQASANSSAQQDDKTDLEAAINHPRIHIQDDVIHIEKLDEQALLISIKEKIQNWPSTDMFFGGVNAVLKTDKTIQAAGDPRRYGQAVYAID